MRVSCRPRERAALGDGVALLGDESDGLGLELGRVGTSLFPMMMDLLG